MKNIYFELNEFECAKFKNPIRDKKDIVLLELFLLKNLLILKDFELHNINVKNSFVRLFISKNSRFLIKLNDDYYYSLCFPFNISITDEKTLNIKYVNEEINSMVANQLISIVNNMSLPSYEQIFECCSELSNDYTDINCDFIIEILNFLFTYDDGYLRFENDLPHANERFHPQFHIDIFYSNEATFKIGLNNHITIDDFFQILDNKSKTKYLK